MIDVAYARINSFSLGSPNLDLSEIFFFKRLSLNDEVAIPIEENDNQRATIQPYQHIRLDYLNYNHQNN